MAKDFNLPAMFTHPNLKKNLENQIVAALKPQASLVETTSPTAIVSVPVGDIKGVPVNNKSQEYNKKLEEHKRNIDEQFIAIFKANRTKSKNEPTIEFKNALDSLKKQVRDANADSWNKTYRYNTHDDQNPPAIIQSHQINVVYGNYAEPQDIQSAPLSAFTDFSYNRLVTSKDIDFVALFCGIHGLDDVDLEFIPNNDTLTFAKDYSLSFLVCLKYGLLEEAKSFSSQLSNVKKGTPPRSRANSLSKNYQLQYLKRYSRNLIEINKVDETSNILKNTKREEILQINVDSKAHKDSKAIYRAYIDIINGVEYLINLGIEIGVLFEDKGALDSKYTGRQLKGYLGSLRNSVRNALATNMIASQINYAMKNGIAVYIDLLPIQLKDADKTVLEKLNDILTIADRPFAYQNQLPTHINYFLNFLKNFLHSELATNGSERLPKIPLDVRNFLQTPQVIRTGEMYFDSMPLTVNIAYYFDARKAERSLEQTNCIACHVFNFEPSQPLDEHFELIPVLANSVETPLKFLNINAGIENNYHLVFHEMPILVINTADKAYSLINNHFSNIFKPISDYMSGIVAKQLTDINNINNSASFPEMKHLNTKQKQVFIYNQIHKKMTPATYDFFQKLCEDEIVLKAIKILPKPSAIKDIHNNLAVPVLATCFDLLITAPHQYFGEQGEFLFDLGFDQDNKHYAFYLGSNSIIQLPESMSDDLWGLVPKILPDTHYIEPMALVISLEGDIQNFGNYSRFDINRWFKNMPANDAVLFDAINFDDDNALSEFDRKVFVDYLLDDRRVGRFT